MEGRRAVATVGGGYGRRAVATVCAAVLCMAAVAGESVSVE
jgi:hypothetical protein